jgi:hypothetical protein
MEIDVEEYVDTFKPTLMDVVYRWVRWLPLVALTCAALRERPQRVAHARGLCLAQSNGCEFSELLKNCDLFEGTIIRAVRPLRAHQRTRAQLRSTHG